jgi:AhpD family alkylhydroperoxidase
MTQFTVPQRQHVSQNNQAIFDKLKNALGMVPNLYAAMAYSDTALENYLALQNGKTSLDKKEKEAINLIASQVNNCRYCQSAHTVLGKMNGFTEEQTIDIRQGEAPFDLKLDALVKFVREAILNKGKVSESTLNNFLNAGYTKGSIIDVIIAIADKVVMNYIHNLTQVPIDFPLAKPVILETAVA